MSVGNLFLAFRGQFNHRKLLIIHVIYDIHVMVFVGYGKVGSSHADDDTAPME